MKDAESIVKWAIGLSFGAGFLVLLAKNAGPLGDFMQSSAKAVTSLGQGIGSIGGA